MLCYCYAVIDIVCVTAAGPRCFHSLDVIVIALAITFTVSTSLRHRHVCRVLSGWPSWQLLSISSTVYTRWIIWRWLQAAAAAAAVEVVGLLRRVDDDKLLQLEYNTHSTPPASRSVLFCHTAAHTQTDRLGGVCEVSFWRLSWLTDWLTDWLLLAIEHWLTSPFTLSISLNLCRDHSTTRRCL